MGLFDFMTGLKNKVLNSMLFENIMGNYAKENTPTEDAKPKVPSYQYDANGDIDYTKTLDVMQKTTPIKPYERLFGRTMTLDKQETDPETGKTSMETFSNFRPGIFQDISSGYRENRFNPISIDNLAPNQGKNWANRIGEGLGTIARIGESPLGRSLLVGGIVGASGGSGLEALAYGAGTGMTNQGLRMQDKMYRQSLINEYGFSPEVVNSLRGYVDAKTFENMTNARLAKENAEWRRMLVDRQNKNDAQMMDFKRSEAAREQNNFDKKLAFDYEKLSNDKTANKNTSEQDLAEVKQQLDNFSAMFDRMPGKAESYTLGKLRGWTGMQTQDEANFNSQRTLLFNQIARKLGGEKGVLSDQDIKRIEAALPNLTDSKKQKDAKMKAVYDLLDIRSGKGVGNDPLGIRG